LWLSQLHKIACSNKQIDLADWAQWLALDVVMDVVFGAPVGFVEAGKDVNNLINSIKELFWASTVLGHLPGLVKLLQFPVIWNLLAPTPKDKNGIGFVMGIAEQAVSRRLGNGKERESGHGEGKLGAQKGRRDVLQHWVEYRDKDGKGMTQDEIQLEALGPMYVSYR
jgi:hypothetical protein